MVNIDGLTTETVNEAARNIDELDSPGVVMLINNEDKKVALTVEKELLNIARAVDETAVRFKRDGRIIYCGTGSLEHMGTLDAVELAPTYSVSPDQASDLLAGGEIVMYKAVKGAENSKELILEDLKGIQITEDDCTIGIVASGRTPYTISVLEYINEVGVLSISITYNGESKVAKIADIFIAPTVGAEAVGGSTRMRAGTAQKMAVNMLSTATMVRLGRVYHSYMVRVQSTNEELVVRATRTIVQATGMEEDKALAVLESAGFNVPETIIMLEDNYSRETVRKALGRANDQVRKAIEIIKR